MPRNNTLAKTLTIRLGQLKQPVVTDYELFCEIHGLYKTKSFQNNKLPLTKERPERSDFSRLKTTLTNRGVLQPLNRKLPYISKIVGKSQSTVQEVLCTIDPFMFISHLSAMSYHGITNRIPKTTFVTTLPLKEWRSASQLKYAKDLGVDYKIYLKLGFPKLRYVRITEIMNSPINVNAEKHMGSYIRSENSNVRISSIARVFLEMVRRPDLCGGINHVIEVFEANAKLYSSLFIDEIDTYGTPIEKIRTAYILDERCGLTNLPILNKWLKYVARGGSRKLDPKAPYNSTFSERWSISINT